MSSHPPPEGYVPSDPLPAPAQDDEPDVNDVFFGPSDVPTAPAVTGDRAEWEEAPAEIGPPDINRTVPPIVPVPSVRAAQLLHLTCRTTLAIPSICIFG